VKIKHYSFFVVLFSLLLAPCLLRAEDKQLSALPFKTAHVAYRLTMEGLNLPDLDEQKADLYIDAAANKIAYVMSEGKSSKVLQRKVFDGKSWYTLIPALSSKYVPEPSQINPLLELFQSYNCAPYPKQTKVILGHESAGCEIGGRSQFFWQDIMLESSGNAGPVKMTNAATAVELDKSLDQSVFLIPQEKIGEKGEFASAFSQKFKGMNKIFEPQKKLRFLALAVVNESYRKLLPDKSKAGETDWDKVLEQADQLDGEWAKPLGWNKEQDGSPFDFVQSKDHELEPKAKYHTELARELAHGPDKNAAEAIKHLDSALQKNPFDSSSYMQRAAFYAEQPDYEKALSDCNEAIKLSSHFGVEERIISRAGIFCGMKNCDKALHDIGLVLQFHEEETRLRKEQLEEMAKLADEKMTKDLRGAQDRQVAGIYEQRGDLNYRCSKQKDAVADYEKALDFYKLLPNSDSPLASMDKRQTSHLSLKLAYISGSLGKPEDGLKYVEQALAAGSDEKRSMMRGQAYLLRFYLHRKLKQHDEMLEDLRLAEKH
jgi:tetratricopeptide (TPR) repeat protein